MTVKHSKLLFFLAAACCVLFLALCAYIGFKSLETKSSACECEDPIDGQRLAAINPFRSRAPERVAIDAMRKIQSGRCEEIPEDAHYCVEEKTLRLVSWKLTGRKSGRGSFSFRFMVWRTQEDKPAAPEPVWITVESAGSTWRLSNIDMYF